jgi:O-antigen/teichoic acid export membrane protein
MLLTGAAFLSKILGMLYVIPFNELVGAEGGALYFYAYNPYTILISISTVGVPLAVSKIVSKYNSLGFYDIGLRIFRVSLVMMAITGLLAFIILYFSSGWLASKIIYSDTYGNSVDDIKQVIRMVSFALLLIPGMSVVRGFFQGNQSMGPTAVSEVIEQIIRIGFVLIAAFIIMIVLKGTYATAVSYATFAAFVGAIASCIVLFGYWQRRKNNILQLAGKQRKTYQVSTKELLIELFSYAGPFVLVGIATPLYQFVDMFTFNKAMGVIGLEKIAELSLATINFYGHKLIIIPVTIATGLSLAIVPALTESFTKQNRKKLTKEINQALQIVLLLVIPAVIGLISLANQVYGSLFGMSNLNITGTLLAWYAPIALAFALFTVTAAILQGINEQRFALVSLSAGFLIKLICNSVFIHSFGAKGSIFATGLAVTVAVMLNLWKIKSVLIFSFKQTAKRLLFILIFSAMMGFAIVIIKYIFGFFLPYDTSRLAASVMLIIGVLTGGIIYLFLVHKSTLLDFILGNMNILNRFRRDKHAPR